MLSVEDPFQVIECQGSTEKITLHSLKLEWFMKQEGSKLEGKGWRSDGMGVAVGLPVLALGM